MGRFHDDFSSSIGKLRALKLWTIICTCVRNDLFVDLDIGVQEQNSLINIETLNSELCLLAILWQNGTENRKRPLLVLRTINVNSEQSSGSDHSWFSRRHRVLMLVESLKSTSEAKARGATEGNYSFSSVTQTFLVRYNSIFQLKAWIEYIKWKSLSGEAKSTMSTPGHERLWCKLTYAEFDSLAVPAVVMCVVSFVKLSVNVLL